jgi:ribose transport system substrate-binding protein
MKRALLILTAMVLLVSLAAQCGPAATPAPTVVPPEEPTQAPEPAAQPTEEPAEEAAEAETTGLVPAQPYTFGVVYNNLVYPWYQAEKAGIERQASEMGVELISLESRDDPAKELANIEDLITKEVDLILLLGTDETTGGKSAELANEAGIPLIALSRATRGGGDVISTIDTNTVVQAETISKYMAELLGGQGKVAQIEGVPGVSNVRMRQEGLANVLADYPNIEMVADVPGYFDPARAEAAMNDILVAHPDITAVYTHNDGMMVGVRKALEAAGLLGEVVTVAFDGEPVAIDAINEGTQTATMGVVPAQEGAMGVIVGVMHLNGMQVPEHIYTPSIIVTQDNLDLFPGWDGEGIGPFTIADTGEAWDPLNQWTGWEGTQ